MPAGRRDSMPRASEGGFPMNGLRPSIATATFLALAAPAFPADEPPTGSNVDMQWGVKIPMRDGVKLNATVYRPRGQKDALPVVFTLTPYIGDSYHDRALYFARARLRVRARRRARPRQLRRRLRALRQRRAATATTSSNGSRKQPWCNGKVAMWGGSYAGFDQWATRRSCRRTSRRSCRRPPRTRASTFRSQTTSSRPTTCSG